MIGKRRAGSLLNTCMESFSAGRLLRVPESSTARGGSCSAGADSAFAPTSVVGAAALGRPDRSAVRGEDLGQGLTGRHVLGGDELLERQDGGDRHAVGLPLALQLRAAATGEEGGDGR